MSNVVAPTAGACSARTVVVRLPEEIHGYPLGASGETAPFLRIAGANTLLTGNGNGYGSVRAGRNGNLHATAFQSNGPGGDLVFASNANGNVPPVRAINVNQDHVALAVDSRQSDDVVASQGYIGDSCWYVVPDDALQPRRSNCDTNVSALYSLATDGRDRLIAIGTDAVNGQGRIDVFSHPSTANPVLVRTIAGPKTGLPPVGPSGYVSVSYSISTNPVTNDLSVFGSGDGVAPRVSEFGPSASGNAGPVRTLSGSHVPLPHDAFAVDVLALHRNGDLYVVLPANGFGLTISVYQPGQHGNAVPARTITDAKAFTQNVGSGIALR